MPSPDRSARPSQLAPIYLIFVGVLLIVGSLVWLIVAAQEVPAAQLAVTAQPVVATQPPAPPNPPAATPRIPYPGVKRVSAADAKAALDLGTAVFIDTRGDPYFKNGHLPGAISMTSSEVPDRLGELKSADWIITYCT